MSFHHCQLNMEILHIFQQPSSLWHCLKAIFPGPHKDSWCKTEDVQEEHIFETLKIPGTSKPIDFHTLFEKNKITFGSPRSPILTINLCKLLHLGHKSYWYEQTRVYHAWIPSAFQNVQYRFQHWPYQEPSYYSWPASGCTNPNVPYMGTRSSISQQL
jgi:hypothetical protein